MTNIAVVILNFNGRDLIRKFLPSVIRYSPGADIIVADNGSTDDSIHVLETEFTDAKIIRIPENLGFCGGYNRALQHVETKYVVILNSDVEVTEGWLQPLQEILDRDDTVAAVQPKILSYDTKNRFEYAGAGGGLIDTLGYPFCRGRIFDHIEDDHGQYDDEREIFWASGACMMIRSEVFRQFGGFDESFFAHMEEIDLCWRAQRGGWRVMYTGLSKVYHLGAGTLRYNDPRKTYLNFRNGLITIYKHFDPAELIYKFPLRVVLDWIAAIVFLIKGSVGACGSVLRAHMHFMRDLQIHRRKRQAIRDAHPTYPRRVIHPRLIILDYYLRGNKSIGVQ